MCVCCWLRFFFLLFFYAKEEQASFNLRAGWVLLGIFLLTRLHPIRKSKRGKKREGDRDRESTSVPRLNMQLVGFAITCSVSEKPYVLGPNYAIKNKNNAFLWRAMKHIQRHTLSVFGFRAEPKDNGKNAKRLSSKEKTRPEKLSTTLYRHIS